MSIRDLLFAAAGAGGEPVPPGPPTEFGQPFQGGYYFGKMNYGVPGEDYWMVVASKISETSLRFKATATADTGKSSLVDGLANTLAGNSATWPSAQYCSNYSSEGYTDWYLGSYWEMELMYRNLKPSTATNYVSQPMGANPYSIPPGYVYTSILPAQTNAPLFKTGGGQALAQDLVGSTEAAATTQYVLGTNTNAGRYTTTFKYNEFLVRPVRRVLITNN